MSYFAVTYTYVDDPGALDEVRPRHRAHLSSLAGLQLVASGPYVGAPVASALLIFRAETRDEVVALLDADPFWQAGLIAERAVEEWNPVIGIFAD